jgi:O-glycosyl hydrolase
MKALQIDIINSYTGEIRRVIGDNKGRFLRQIAKMVSESKKYGWDTDKISVENEPTVGAVLFSRVTKTVKEARAYINDFYRED